MSVAVWGFEELGGGEEESGGGGGVARMDGEHTQYSNLIHRLQDGTGREEG